MAGCFDDYRDEDLIEHSVTDLLKQRVFALALGYEDLNDHDQLRTDPLLATLVGKRDVTGAERVDPRDRGKPLAGKSTLNRLELTPARASLKSRYKKIVARQDDLAAWFVEAFLQLQPQPPAEIVLDLDATDDPIHGQQAGRFFHGYYQSYCYLPLYIFCGEHLLLAKLRPSNIDAAAGSVKQVAWIVAQIRGRWPNVRIILRGDGGFCRDSLLTWCEENRVDFVFGLAKNKRLLKIIGHELHRAGRSFKRPARQRGSSPSSSIAPRRVGAAPAASSAKPSIWRRGATRGSSSRVCPRNASRCGRCMKTCTALAARWRIASRNSSCTCSPTAPVAARCANQLRLWLSSAAYVLLQALREHGLKDTSLAAARCDTIRLKLLKIGAIVRVSVRRVWFSLAHSYPYQQLFQQVLANLRRWLLPAPA